MQVQILTHCFFTYLLDQSDSWQFYESEICSHGTDGRTSVATGLQELEKYGYLIRDWIRDGHGRYIGRVWEVYEEPVESHEIGNPTDCRKPDIGKSEIGESATGKPATNNNNSNDSSKEYKTNLANHAPELIIPSNEAIPPRLREYLISVNPPLVHPPGPPFMKGWIMGDHSAISVQQQIELESLLIKERGEWPPEG